MIMPSYEVIDDAAITYRATIVLTVFKHPQRTLRAINSVLSQDTNGWELLIMGDFCPNLQELINRKYFDRIINEQQLRGNCVKVINLEQNYGGFGYKQRNMARSLARGKYTLYLDNDDQLSPEHVSTRLAAVENSPEADYDMVSFETWQAPINWPRDTAYEFGKIGHSEVMFKTSFLRTLPESDPQYGHDWVLVENALKRQCRHIIIKGPPYTYKVMSIRDNPETGID